MADEPAPEARAFIELAAQGPALHTLPPAAARERHRERAVPSGDREPVGTVEDVVVRGDGHGVPVRVYTPAGDGPFPTLVWAHGGGWVLGDVDTEDATARALTNAGGCVVVSVDYRLAPEHPFPAALRDVVAVLRWAAAGAEPLGTEPVSGSRAGLAVGGASAGATLAAGATLLARDDGGPSIDYQVLVYPATSYTQAFPSRDAYDGYFLSQGLLESNLAQYLADPLHGYNPLAFPLEARRLDGLPPATVVTAGFDMLHDEGVAYADALADAGVSVRHRDYDDMVHTFFGKLGDGEWARAREAVDDVGDDLRDALGR